MSSRTPQECVDLASDTTASREERENAIDELRTANECDELAAVATNDALDADYRRYALEAMATPQCEEMLGKLTEGGDLEGSLERTAETLLDDSSED